MNHGPVASRQLTFDIRGAPAAPVRPVVNVAKVEQLSPLRYPGGKTWLVPEIRSWLAVSRLQSAVFVEPFAGGGVASLTAVILGHVNRAVMSELDAREWLPSGVASLKMLVG